MDGLAIGASLNEIRPAVTGGVIRAVYQPSQSVVSLYVMRGERHRVLISPREASIHLSRLDVPNPASPSPFVMLLRRHIRGGRVTAIRQRDWDRIVTIVIERAHGRRVRTYQLVAELTGVRGNLYLVEDGVILGALRPNQRNHSGATYEALPGQGKTSPSEVGDEVLCAVLESESPIAALVRSVDGMGRETAADIMTRINESGELQERAKELHREVRALLADVSAPHAHISEDGSRGTFYKPPWSAREVATYGAAIDQVLSSADAQSAWGEDEPIEALGRAIRRRQRTMDKLRNWLDEAEQAERLSRWANLLMIYHSEVDVKSAEATLVDPETDEALVIPLNPSLSAIENAQRFYERVKRLRRGRKHVESRLKRIVHELARLEAAQEAIREGRTPPEVEDLLPVAGRRKRPADKRASLRAVEREGFTIWVGRNARDNDRLLRAASADDLWMHAKDQPGSHVIVRSHGSEDVPESVRRYAAQLAATNSKARGERRVPVMVTKVKHVKKPRGAPAGLVHVRKADTLAVEPMKGDE